LIRAPKETPLALKATDRQDLELKLCVSGIRRSMTVRIMIVLMCADGAAPTEIAKLVGVTRSVVYRWRSVFQTFGMAGLFKSRRVQRPRKYGNEIKQQILVLAASPPPQSERWWTAKLIAERLSGIPIKYVSALIRKAGIDLRAGRRKHYRY
jgi:transposase